MRAIIQRHHLKDTVIVQQQCLSELLSSFLRTFSPSRHYPLLWRLAPSALIVLLTGGRA